MNSLQHWAHKDLTSTEVLSHEDISTIFAVASEYKACLDTPLLNPPLKGKTVVNLFMEPSTRTRIAFEVAANNLGAHVISIQETSSSLVKGESLRDTALNIQALKGDVLILRHRAPGSSLYLSSILDMPVINAGDGAHEHPTQALLDCFTLQEKLGSLQGRKVTILGDILFSRVARSNIWLLQKLGAVVTLAGPSTLVPMSFKDFGVNVSHDLSRALKEADAIMLLRIQHERQAKMHFPSLGEYTSRFGLNKFRASWLKPDAIIMHPGPINRGVEIDSDLADSPQSVILNQVTNGIAIRMAVIHLCAHYASLQNTFRA